jgi:hypothetical protein
MLTDLTASNLTSFQNWSKLTSSTDQIDQYESTRTCHLKVVPKPWASSACFLPAPA